MVAIFNKHGDVRDTHRILFGLAKGKKSLRKPTKDVIIILKLILKKSGARIQTGSS